MDNLAKIRLRNTDEYAVIEKADELLISGFVWGLTAQGYAQATRGNFSIMMHRLIAGAGEGEVVDHVNRDTLDNRTCNLRIASHSENGANRIADRRRIGTSSEYKGVSWSKGREKWQAYIHIDGKTHYLGRFANEADAAIAYNNAALKAWGEFARLNDIIKG